MREPDFFDATRSFDSAESILSLLKEVDRDLAGQPPIEVLVVGYSAIMLARRNNRGSNDVDIIPSRFSRVFANRGIETFDEHYFYFCPDYRNRSRSVDCDFANLTVKYADPHDIWLAKLAAFRDKDKVDMRQMIREGVVDVAMLDRLFPQWNRHWFNDSEELTANYREVRDGAAED